MGDARGVEVLDREQTEARSLPALLEASVARWSSRTALVDGPSGRSVDFAELDRRVRCIASWLRADGVGPGSRLATWAPNVPPVAAVTLAAWQVGATVVPLSPAWTVEEARALTATIDLSHVVTVPPLVEAAGALGAGRVVCLGADERVADLDDLLAAAPGDGAHVPQPQPDSTALLCASSGTTGLPKLVALSHRNLVAVTTQIAARIEVTADDVTLALAPWFHIFGITAELLVPLSVGAAVVSVPRFEPGQVLDLLEQHRITYVAVPPPVAAFLAATEDLEQRDLRGLELVAVGGAPLPPEIQARLQHRLPRTTVAQGWGLTETSGAICVPGRRTGTRPGTVGTPLPMAQLRVVDPATLQDLDEGVDGELLVRGPHLMQGYLGRDEETAAMWTPDGWLRTGDLGHVDEDGSVVLVGRLKDLIKVNGLQVAPAEVEQVLVGHPMVKDAAVVGRPHERSGETPVAFVVLTADADTETILADISERLAPYKRPSRLVAVDALPRTPLGKLLRRSLVEPGPS